MTRTPPAFGTPATRLHAGRILLVLALLVGGAVATWVWIFHRGGGASTATPEKGTSPGWTAAQMHYEKPEVKAEAPAPPPVDLTAAELARIKAMLAQLQAELEALKNRKPPASTTVVQQQPKAEPPKKVPGSMLFVSHEVKDGGPKTSVLEYVLAPGATKLPCVIETRINSDVEGYFTAKVSTNIYDTATGRYLLVPQGSTILARDHSLDLLYGNERLPTTSLTLALPDGRSVDLGKAPVTDQQGVAGLTGRVNQHYWRLFGAIFIGGALRGGVQAMQTALAQEAGVGQIAAGYGSVVNQALSPRLGRALDTRPTIEVDAGQLCNILLIKELRLPAMWQ
jgi:type F conjugative transfer system protein TrbI